MSQPDYMDIVRHDLARSLRGQCLAGRLPLSQWLALGLGTIGRCWLMRPLHGDAPYASENVLRQVPGLLEISTINRVRAHSRKLE
jgi:hypothetical protein